MSFQLVEEALKTKDQRRSNLVTYMSDLEKKDTNCSGCRGKCCTFVANSMMVTPIEAYDLYHYLVENDLWGSELEENLDNCIKSFRLNDGLSLGRGREFRRTYTCPFYLNRFPGCPLPRNVKPYGCLAFNPGEGTPKEGEGCHSELSLLIDRESLLKDEEALNLKIKNVLGLNWDKLSIPMALKDIDEKIN